jgi:plastocyanin
MKPIYYLWTTLAFLTVGCQGMPDVTRTGEVRDIIIGDKLSSGELAVSPGDEVRWINKRTAPVRVVFLDPITDKQLSCKENFGGLMTRNDTAKLNTNETASACFRDPGYVRYTVRMKSATLSGEVNVPGVVKVGGISGQATTGEPSSTITTTTTTVTSPSKQ